MKLIPPALLVALFWLAALVAGCSASPTTGAIEVQVKLEEGLLSRCVKVTSTDGTQSRETSAIVLAGKTPPLRVGVLADGLSDPVTLQAFGYSDVECTVLTPGEVSESRLGSFTAPPSTVTLTLRPVVNGDGGSDAGNDAGVDAGTDGGVDAGVDMDMDGFPLPADCDDTNPAIHPGATESCINGADDDCDFISDCQQAPCNAMPCAGGGTCISNVCVALTEALCNDGLDNDNDNLIDCADPECPLNSMCNDFNSCTTGDRCVADGGCAKLGDVICGTPPASQCWVAAGLCLPDAGASCQYTQMGGGCNDDLGCTDTDTCTSGACSGTPRTCTTPPNGCFQPTGSCQEPAGACNYAPRTAGTGTCNDGQNCTTNDTCDGDGGCTGTAVSCPALSQCHNPSSGCDVAGTCLYSPRTGLACDAGTGTGAGTCDGTFNCNPPSSLFPFTPSNFTDAQLPSGAGTAITVSCATTLSTSGTPSITNGGCVTMPPFSIITQGGESTVLMRVSGLTVNSGQTLTITGTRPVIFAVTGDVFVDGIIRARNGNGPAACGNGGNGDDSGSGNGFAGGGGGGFGSTGATGGTAGGAGAGSAGGVNGLATLIPLRGGCNGGNGTSGGGAGGGSIQLTASGTITVANTIAAPGRGGTGASGTAGNSGGGGGSGGAILLEGASVQVNSSARITANGASGGEGSGGNAGENGLDGNETSSNTTANGGDGSGNGGNGGVGAGGTNPAGPGASGAGPNDGSGGGGGGVGRIRINAMSCTIAGSGLVVSPSATSNGGTNCP